MPEEPTPPAPETIHGVTLFLFNPMGSFTSLSGESGKQYLFQRVAGQGERHSFHCGTIEEFRKIRRDIMGEDDRLSRFVPYALGVDFMTEADVVAKRTRDAASVVDRSSFEAAAKAHYTKGLPAGIIDNARTLIRLKREREALALRLDGTGLFPAAAAPLALSLADLDATLGHNAQALDRMTEDHKAAYSEEKHAALCAEVQAIFDGSAVSRSGIVVASVADAGPVGSIENGEVLTPVELPPGLVIRDRLTDEDTFSPFGAPNPTFAPVVVTINSETKQVETAPIITPPTKPKRGRPPKVRAPELVGA